MRKSMSAVQFLRKITRLGYPLITPTKNTPFQPSSHIPGPQSSKLR